MSIEYSEYSPSRYGDGVIFLTALQVRRRYQISDMTLFRWLRDPELRFPQPMIIHTRRYFDAAQLDQFDRRQAARSREATDAAA